MSGMAVEDLLELLVQPLALRQQVVEIHLPQHAPLPVSLLPKPKLLRDVRRVHDRIVGPFEHRQVQRGARRLAPADGGIGAILAARR